MLCKSFTCPCLYFVNLHGDNNHPGDDMLAAGAVEINPADGFIIGSPEKTAEGDDVGMLGGSAAESALPHVEPVSGGVDKREGKKPHIF
ncbi:hypothetical protein Bca4012_006841 [Brassica carinata]